ncbi:MAG: OmpH family outer membrane protein [Bacteroidales bacterium]|nr:OmpH family outer membrane protein [Bacteroidales bacterium]
MQRVYQISIIVLFAAVVVLFVIVFRSNNAPLNSQQLLQNDTNHVVKQHKIAFVNVDSLLKNYKFYTELENKLLDKQKRLESDLNRKMASFEKEVQDFQKKVQMNSFISEESARRQQQDLMMKEQELYKLRDDLSMQLAKETQDLEKQLLDTVTNFLKEFNANHDYDFIFNKAALLYGDETLDITDTLIYLLNKRYEAIKSK